LKRKETNLKNFYSMERIMKAKCFGKLFVLISFILILFNQALPSGFSVSGVGSKAISMGGAFRGLADDWSAAYWNPAGLAYLEKSEVSATYIVLSPRPDYIPDVFYGGENSYAVGFKNGIKWYPFDKNIQFPNFSGFVNLKKFGGFTTGLAFYLPYTMKFNWDLYQPPTGYKTSSPYPKVNHMIDIDVFDFHPTIAKEVIKEKLSLGLGISVQFANFTLRRTTLLHTDSAFIRPYDNFPIDCKLDEDGWGFGFNFGILFKPMPKLQVGASYRSQVTMDLSGKTNLTLYLPYDPSYSTEVPRKDSLLFLGGNPSWEVDEDVGLKLPAEMGIGVSYQPFNKLTLAMDISQTNWSVMDNLEPKFLLPFPTTQPDTVVPQTLQIPLQWEDVVRYSLGVEYQLLKKLAVRGGYYSDPSPSPDKTFSPLFLDVGDKNGISLGFSYRFNSIELGYNYEYLDFKERKINQLEDINGDGVFDNYPGWYKMNMHSSYFTFIYHF
jgi:long-chain fatty acid transport protein